MATVATYVFTDENNWHKAISALRQKITSTRDECLSIETGYEGNNGCIYITSYCNDPSLAAQICSGYGGKPY